MVTGKTERNHAVNTTNAVTKETLKEIYSESKKKLKIILNLLGKMHKENQFSVPSDPQVFHTMSDLLLKILHAIEMESDNQYRNAIVEIADWMHRALNVEFIEQNQKKYPHPLFVIKKGAEMLHSFLHRDLRRKQFSSEENEIYQNYLALIRKLPNPKP